MKTYTKEELKNILEQHALWLKDNTKGKKANLSGAMLSGTDFYKVDLSGADLSGASLILANFSKADLCHSNLSGANLSSANFSKADLYGANLSGAKLFYTNLSGADLFLANLSKANLSDANLSSVNLSRTNLSNTILENKVMVAFQFNRHLAYYFGLDEIRIGCHRKSIDEWLSSYEEIGKKQEYTPEEIAKYGKFIRSCAKDYKKGGNKK